MPDVAVRLARCLAAGLTAILCSIVMLSATLTGPQPGSAPAPPAVSPDAPARPAGEVSARYKQFCASCHGIDGQGFGSAAYDEARGEFVGDLHDHRPANLTCPGVGLTRNEDLEIVVRGGISCRTHGQVMPAFPDLTQTQFSEIADQVRAFAHQHAPQISPDDR